MLITKEVAEEHRGAADGLQWSSKRQLTVRQPETQPRRLPAPSAPTQARDTRHFQEETQIIWQHIDHTGTVCACVFVCTCVCA